MWMISLHKNLKQLLGVHGLFKFKLSTSTVYWETLTKGIMNEFDKSWPNCQTNIKL